MKELTIVCGILLHQQRVLIARRGAGVHENIWEFPGGKVEAGESHEQAVVRELREELELNVKVVRYLTTIEDVREDCILHVHAYLCHVIKGTLTLHVHHEAKYVGIQELSAYGFEPADDAILLALQALAEKRKHTALMFLLAGITAAVILVPIGFLFMMLFHAPHVWLRGVVQGCFLLMLVYYGLILAHGYQRIRLARGIHWKMHSCFLVSIGLCLALIFGSNLYDRMQPTYETLSNEVDLTLYQPFKSDRLAVLAQPSTLQLQDSLPRLDGATAFYPIYASFVQAVYPQKEYDPYMFEQQEVICSTTPSAYQSLIEKQRDVIFVLGPSQEQVAAAATAGETMMLTPIGKEAFVFFVNVDNPIVSLTTQQVKDIYSGKITNWKEVGGLDEEIKAFQRPEGSGSQTALERFMNGTEIMEPLQTNLAQSMGGIIMQTAEYENRKNAIGYSFRFYTSSMVDSEKIRLLKIDDVYPDKETIRSGSYPLIDEFYAIRLASNDKRETAQLIDWILSTQGQQLIEASGYVGIK